MSLARPSDRILSFHQVRAIVGLSRTTIWRLCRSGGFPKPIPLSAHRVGWPETAVQAWLQERVERVDAAA